MKPETSIFKPYLQGQGSSYAGGKSKDEVQSDKPIYKLSSNENMLGASPKALAAIKEHLHTLNEYPDRTDIRLRQALSDFHLGILGPEQFVTANSGVGILDLIVFAFMEEGLECIVSNPAFKPYIQFPGKVGAAIKDVPLKGANFELDVDGILTAITPQTRLIWLCSPNNPTGTYIPRDKVEALINEVPDHVVVVYDEVYYQFVNAMDYTRALPFVQAGKNVIGVNSFSKAYGLAGMRIGYAYSTPEIAQYISKIGRPFLIDSLSMEAAIAALEDQAFIEETVSLINTEKVFLYEALDKLGVKYWQSQANFVLIQPEMEDLLFEQKMLEEGIMVRPSAPFGAPNCIRVTIGTRAANEAYIEALKKIIQ